MRKFLLGFALILFGILLELAGLNGYISLIGYLPSDLFGLVFGLVGVGFVIAGRFDKKQ